MIRTALSLGLCLSVFACATPTIEGTTDPFPIAAPESQGLSAEVLGALAAEVQGYVDRDLVVGAELLVIQNRRTVRHECFGYADRAEERPWSIGTVCNIRSMTKPLTGAAIQLLIDRGLLSPDDPAAKFLPGFDTDAARGITVRQILSHRAGLPLTILSSIDEFDDLVAMGNAVGARGPEFPPDTKFWYSDSGTDALGAIVEVVSGRTLDEFVKDELLDPLGMDESFYYLDAEDPRRTKIASLYVGGAERWQRFWNPLDKPFYPFAWGSQTLYSTPLDYAKFLAMWMDRGTGNGKRVLSEEAVLRTLTPVCPMSLLGSDASFPTSFTGLDVHYGQMSVLHVPTEAAGQGPATIVGHSGSDGTIAWAWPARDLMVLLFTQSRGGGAVLRFEAVLDRLLIAPENHVADSSVDPALAPYLGTYVADFAQHMNEKLVVAVENGKLVLDIPSQMVFELVPAEEPGRWHFAISAEVTIWFEENEQGEKDCLMIGQGPMTFEAPREGTERARRTAEATAVDPAVVEKYLGRYLDPETDEPVEILVEGRYLCARFPQVLTHLWEIPGAGRWLVRENPMLMISFQEEGGLVVSLTRHGPNGELICPRTD